MATENYVESLFDLPCKLFYWHITEKGWRGGKNGKMYIIPYDNAMKSKLLFIPLDSDDCMELLMAVIHPALSVGRYVNDTRSIVFGKATSLAYTNSKGKAIRTTWKASFQPYWAANNCMFILSRLIEHGGNVSSFNVEDNVNLVPLDEAEELEEEEASDNEF